MTLSDVVAWLSDTVNVNDTYSAELIGSAPKRQYAAANATECDVGAACSFEPNRSHLQVVEELMLRTALQMNAPRDLLDAHLRAMHQAHPNVPTNRRSAM